MWDASGMEKVVYSTPEEARLKRRLKFYFMNPWQKYEATGRPPWKLLLQIVKVFLGECIHLPNVGIGTYFMDEL